jgi:hypothetical protein
MYKEFCIYLLRQKNSVIQFGEGANGMAEQIFIRKRNLKECFLLQYWAKITQLKAATYRIGMYWEN